MPVEADREIRVYLFDGGSIDLPLRNFTMGAGDAGERIVTPVIWALITHPRGNVIVDGGNAPEVAVDAKKHWGAITEMSSVTMAPEQAAIPSIESVGVEPESVRWIVQSHLHLDHTGALAVLDRFPNAQVLCTRTEYEWAHAPDSYTALGYIKADFVKPGVPWVLLEESDDGWDLFGDGTLRCWRTPGHSPGHQSFEVNLPSGETLLLCVDAANALEHYEEKALPGFLVDALATVRSVRRLQRLAWRSQATVIAGHDPEQWPQLKQAPDYYS